jgi:CRP/FNR family cyclic AMP-dependent transcriptional regulator
VLDLTKLFGRDQSAFTVAGGKHIFELGDQSRDMYVVLSGQVDIVIEEKLVETVEPGGIFGEMALIDPAPRSASAVARGDTRLVAVDPHRFQVVIQQTPYFAIQVMSVLADRLRRRNLSPDLPDYSESN